VGSRLILSCADDVVEVFGGTREWTGIKNRTETSRLARFELRCQSRQLGFLRGRSRNEWIIGGGAAGSDGCAMQRLSRVPNVLWRECSNAGVGRAAKGTLGG